MRIAGTIRQFHQQSRGACIAAEPSSNVLEDGIHIGDFYVKIAGHFPDQRVICTESARFDKVAIVERKGVHCDDGLFVAGRAAKRGTG